MQENPQMTSYRQTLKERIVVKAMSLFTRHGVKAVKMDDIATCLGISKRTLYEIYENKEVLLLEGVKKTHYEREADLLQYAETAANVIDIIHYVYKQKTRDFQLVSPVFFEDIQKYPHVLRFLEDLREKNHEQFIAFMRRGVSEGFFRSDVNYQLISDMLDALGDDMRSHLIYQQYTFEEIFRNILFVFLRGFCTLKGVEAFDKVCLSSSQ
jgi:AcrR family transcriptional regulator